MFSKTKTKEKKEAYLCCLFSKIQKYTASHSTGLCCKAVVPGGGPEIFPQPPGVKLQGSWMKSGNAAAFACWPGLPAGMAWWPRGGPQHIPSVGWCGGLGVRVQDCVRACPARKRRCSLKCQHLHEIGFCLPSKASSLTTFLN